MAKLGRPKKDRIDPVSFARKAAGYLEAKKIVDDFEKSLKSLSQ